LTRGCSGGVSHGRLLLPVQNSYIL
jgi:hypothetical protein